MSSRVVLLLGVAALVVMVLALVLVGRMPAGADGDPGLLLPDLREQVNEIEAIDIIDSAGELAVQLRRECERWRVVEKSGYEASFEQVHALLRDLARARRAEERTSNPDWYARIGVADPGAPDSSGVMVSFPETDLGNVILGQPDSAGIGRFARIHGEQRSWLIDVAPEVPATAIEWLERAIMDIPADELAEVTIRHPDGDTVRLRPAGDGSDQWVLLDVPEGRQAVSGWQLRPVANALARLNLEDVRPARDIPDDVVRALYRTNDGLNFVISLFADEDARWVQFSVSAEALARDEEDQHDEEVEQLAVDAVAIDGRLSPWQFAISQEKYREMTRRMEDLLRDPES